MNVPIGSLEDDRGGRKKSGGARAFLVTGVVPEHT
jgi:hypothetical protein